MSEQEKTAGIPAQNPSASSSDRLIKVDGMFENWFLDYASYVILERAVPGHTRRFQARTAPYHTFDARNGGRAVQQSGQYRG